MMTETGINFKEMLKNLLSLNSPQNVNEEYNEFTSIISSDNFWKQLVNTNPENRINLLEEIKTWMHNHVMKRTDIERIWVTTNDLLGDETSDDIKHSYFKFLVSLISSQKHNLEILRPIIFDKINLQKRISVEYKMLVVNALTENGKNTDLLENEIDTVLFDWMKYLLSDEVFLGMLSNILKFNSSNLNPFTVCKIVIYLCQSMESPKPEVSRLSLLKVLNEIVCFGCLPLSALQQTVSTVCYLYNATEELHETTWTIFRNLLGSQLGGSIAYVVRQLLHDDIEDFSRLCGAVQLISLGLWGTSPVTSMSYLSRSILSVFLHCATRKETKLVYTIVEAVKLMISSQGHELDVDSWSDILHLVEIISNKDIPNCNQTPEVVPRNNKLIYSFHDLLSLIEKLWDNQIFQGDAAKLFGIVECVVSYRPESSLILLLKYKTNNLKHGRNWFEEINQILDQFLNSSMKSKVQCLAIEKVSKLFQEHFYAYHKEISPNFIIQKAMNLVDESSDEVRDSLLCMLCHLYKLVETRHQVVKIFHQFITPNLRSDRVSSISLCINLFTESPDDVDNSESFKFLLLFLRSYYERSFSDNKLLYKERISAFKTLLSSGIHLKDFINNTTDVYFTKNSPFSYLYDLFTCVNVCINLETNWLVLSEVLKLLTQAFNENFYIYDQLNAEIFELIIEDICKLFSNPSKAYNRDELQLQVIQVLQSTLSHNRHINITKQRLILRTLNSGSFSRCSKFCINSLTHCLTEFDREALLRILPNILLRLSQMSATVQLAPTVLEFLSTLSQLPPLYQGFAEEEYKSIFAVALQHTNTDKFSIFVVSLAQYVVCNWFVKCRDNFKSEFVSHITRILQNVSKDDEKSVQNMLVESCLDLMASYMYTSDIPTASPNRFNPDENSVTWLLGNRLVTVSTGKDIVKTPVRKTSSDACDVTTENSSGVATSAKNKDDEEFWATVDIRRPSGHTSWHVASNNLKSFMPNESSKTLPPVVTTDEDLGLRRRSNTVSSSSDYKINRNKLTRTLSNRQISPNHIFLQLFYTSIGNNSQNRPILIKNSVQLHRTLQLLDMIPPYDAWGSGVVYVSKGQGSNGRSIVLNLHGSPRYQSFISTLGNLVCLNDCDERKSYLSGLDFSERKTDGTYTYIWQEKIMQMVFHIATLMPNQFNDPGTKTRHIGNDYVVVVFDESLNYQPGCIIGGQVLSVEIVLTPIVDRQLFRVSIVFHKPEVQNLLDIPLVRFVSEANIGLVVKQLCLYASMASFSVCYKGKPDLVTSKTTARLKYIRRIRNQTLEELSKSNPNVASRYNSNSTLNKLDEFTDYV